MVHVTLLRGENQNEDPGRVTPPARPLVAQCRRRAIAQWSAGRSRRWLLEARSLVRALARRLAVQSARTIIVRRDLEEPAALDLDHVVDPHLRRGTPACTPHRARTIPRERHTRSAGHEPHTRPNTSRHVAVVWIPQSGEARPDHSIIRHPHDAERAHAERARPATTIDHRAIGRSGARTSDAPGRRPRDDRRSDNSRIERLGARAIGRTRDTRLVADHDVVVVAHELGRRAERREHRGRVEHDRAAAAHRAELTAGREPRGVREEARDHRAPHGDRVVAARREGVVVRAARVRVGAEPPEVARELAAHLGRAHERVAIEVVLAAPLGRLAAVAALETGGRRAPSG